RQLSPEIVFHHEMKVRALVQAVGGLPLALTLLGNYLRKQSLAAPSRRTAGALERLSDAQVRLQISEPHLQSGSHPSIPSTVPISLNSIIEISDRFLSASARE